MTEDGESSTSSKYIEHGQDGGLTKEKTRNSKSVKGGVEPPKPDAVRLWLAGSADYDYMGWNKFKGTTFQTKPEWEALYAESTIQKHFNKILTDLKAQAQCRRSNFDSREETEAMEWEYGYQAAITDVAKEIQESFKQKGGDE